VAEGYEWDYWPQPDGELFTDKHGNTVVGWHDRTDDHADGAELRVAFQAYYRGLYGADTPLFLRPILTRFVSDVECRINGWDEGTFVRCTERAASAEPKWQVEVGTRGESKR
jgi:hypothetical protein